MGLLTLSHAVTLKPRRLEDALREKPSPRPVKASSPESSQPRPRNPRERATEGEKERGFLRKESSQRREKREFVGETVEESPRESEGFAGRHEKGTPVVRGKSHVRTPQGETGYPTTTPQQQSFPQTSGQVGIGERDKQ